MLFMESFDAVSLADLAKKWTVANVSFVTGRSGQGISMGFFETLYKDFAPIPVARAGVAYRVIGALGGYPIKFSSSVGLDPWVQLHVLDDGRLAVTSSGSALSAGSLSVITLGNWYFIELEAQYINGAGTTSMCVFTVRVNDRVVLSDVLTGLPTVGAGSDVWTRVALQGKGGGVNNELDDFYLNDYGLLGDGSVYVSHPNADGGTLDWVPQHGGAHYVEIDETVPDGDASTIESSNVGDVDLAYLAPVNPSMEIHGIQSCYFLKTDEGPGTEVQPTYDFGGVPYDSLNRFVPTADYEYGLEGYPTNPATAAPFTPADIITMQQGLRRTA